MTHPPRTLRNLDQAAAREAAALRTNPVTLEIRSKSLHQNQPANQQASQQANPRANLHQRTLLRNKAALQAVLQANRLAPLLLPPLNLLKKVALAARALALLPTANQLANQLLNPLANLPASPPANPPASPAAPTALLATLLTVQASSLPLKQNFLLFGTENISGLSPY